MSSLANGIDGPVDPVLDKSEISFLFYVYFAINIIIYSNLCYFWNTIFELNFFGPVGSPIVQQQPVAQQKSQEHSWMSYCSWDVIRMDLNIVMQT